MPAQFLDITPSTQVGTYTDPVYVAMAKKKFINAFIRLCN